MKGLRRGWLSKRKPLVWVGSFKRRENKENHRVGSRYTRNRVGNSDKQEGEREKTKLQKPRERVSESTSVRHEAVLVQGQTESNRVFGNRGDPDDLDYSHRSGAGGDGRTEEETKSEELRQHKQRILSIPRAGAGDTDV